MLETMQTIALWALQNLLWNIVMAGAAAVAATAAVKKGLGYLKSRQNLFWFSGGSFVLVLALSFITNQNVRSYPNLRGNIEAIYTTAPTPELPQSPHALVIIETLTNSGSMASVAYTWRVFLKHGAQTIDCPTAEIPDTFTIILPARGSIPQRTV